jgi:hypothetical protein
LYVEIGHDRVVNRLTYQVLDETSLKAEMTAENYTPPAGEIGKAAAWLAANTGPWSGWPAPPVVPPVYQPPDITQPAGLPITGDAGGTKTAVIDFDFHSQNIPTGGLTATITYDIGGGDQTLNAQLAAGTTPSQAAEIVRQGIASVAGLGATKTGTQITVTPDDTVALSKLTVTLA